ncbi:hypothetical protein EHS25_002724 [Saitozyma podzolica]|uniref:UBC core domain-containing protein n=1 Tax=Saitozyma podzolica TaxID=1890683 RepID=A0A427YD86_9TREE|nr:hypothetical protein EHS25_002724 [Saitozyma podzolica]
MPTRQKRASDGDASSSTSPTKRITRSSIKAAASSYSYPAPSGSGSCSRSPVADSPAKMVDSQSEVHAALYSDFDIPIEDLAAHIAVAEALETTRPVPAPSSPPPSPPTEVRRGRKGWKADVQGCMRRWGKRGVVQGYAGIEATIEREWWICCELTYETVEGTSGPLSLQIVFDELQTYPSSYTLLLFADEEVSLRTQRVFERFSSVYDLSTKAVVQRIVSALQGDDDMNGDKPSSDEIASIVRGKSEGFYLSAPLLHHLKLFPRAYQLRTAYSVDWATADRIGLCEHKSREVFTDGVYPVSSVVETRDPVALGFENNLELCAFHWVLRRFVDATKYCLNCGLEVALPSHRPYVCDKPLCLYGFMSLGLGPSVEHVIKTQPGVVDLLLSFAYSAASSMTRMDLPLELNIETPDDKLLDDTPEVDRRPAILRLIEKLPKVSEIKAALESGTPLREIDAPAGSIGVLRWVVGSCRAYLKEAKPGEGVLNSMANALYANTYGSYGSNVTASAVRQFTFVVGSPEQETNFKKEIETAQSTHENCKAYPTILAFHGSAAERWHNILRLGLNFDEMANGRSYGDGVYFAPDAETSMGTYARGNTAVRPNADFPVVKATALVELVNVPNTFVRSNPYYVVANTKQIKPFLLLVHGTGDPAPQATVHGSLFQHDPGLALKSRFGGQLIQLKMPDKLKKKKFVDKEEDDEGDAKIYAASTIKFTPSDKTRLNRLQLMPPSQSTSVSATRALGKEFKELVRLQDQGELPFHLDPDGASLYCWMLELFEFPEFKLKEDMARHGVRSIIAELRFPATFPHSPPFMRVLHPRFLPFAQGGGGNITAGGSICNEILTATGWNPAFCVEAIVRDIMTNMTEAIPPARLDSRSWDTPYTPHEAVEAYKRVAMQHGWAVPKGFDMMSRYFGSAMGDRRKEGRREAGKEGGREGGRQGRREAGRVGENDQIVVKVPQHPAPTLSSSFIRPLVPHLSLHIPLRFSLPLRRFLLPSAACPMSTHLLQSALHLALQCPASLSLSPSLPPLLSSQSLTWLLIFHSLSLPRLPVRVPSLCIPPSSSHSPHPRRATR